MNILVTGASGFIGKQFSINVNKLDNVSIKAVARKYINNFPKEIDQVIVPDINENTDWGDIIKNCDVILHTASIVHDIKGQFKNMPELYWKLNVKGTINLAKQAAKSKIKRFIFLSSIKVNGEINSSSSPFSAEDIPNPIGYYAVSKYEAEKGLIKIANKTNMEVVILRPVLVYGKNVKGNFSILLKWIYNNLPIPISSTKNMRSFLSLNNLIEVIIICLTNNKAINQTFLVTDGFEISLFDLINRIAKFFNKKPFIVPINKKLLRFLFTAIGKKKIYNSFYESQYVDISKTIKTLDWNPHGNQEISMKETLNSFLKKIK